jgi:spore maturation protein CgeB
MTRTGWSPSIRLFEAAACGVPIVSDWWPGLDRFFVPGEEILVANSTEDVLAYLQNTSESERKSIGYAARKKILNAHTSAHRAAELEEYVREALKKLALSKPAYSGGRAVWRKP